MPKLKSPRFPEAIKAVVIVCGGPAELSRKIGVKRQQIEDWCNGKKPVPPKYVVAIVNAYGQPTWAALIRPDRFGELTNPMLPKLSVESAATNG